MSVPKNGPGQPRLSNYLTSLAADVAEAAAAFKRSSLEAHGAYLAAGAKLVEARGECRRGQWGPFLAACGVEPRTARNMMTLSRAGLSAADVTGRGGVQASIDSLRLAAAVAVDAAAVAVDAAAEATEGGEKTESDSGFSGPPLDPTAHETHSYKALPAGEPEIPGLADGPAPAYGEAAAGTDRGSESGPAGTGGTGPDSRTAAQRRRDERRAAGRCIDCGADCGDTWHVRCPACRARIARTDRKRRDDAELGAVLGPRFRYAARQGRGVRLTAADVAGLVTGERERFVARLAKVGRRAPKGRKRGDSGAGGERGR